LGTKGQQSSGKLINPRGNGLAVIRPALSHLRPSQPGARQGWAGPTVLVDDELAVETTLFSLKESLGRSLDFQFGRGGPATWRTERSA
jgi:hypothetical protein